MSSTRWVIRSVSDSTRLIACATSSGSVVPFALRQFGVAADRRQRGAQFVAGVGDELAHPGLAGVPRGQRAGDVVEHPVQRGAELADLGVRAGRVDLDDRRRQPHLAAVQLQVGHLPGGGGNPLTAARVGGG